MAFVTRTADHSVRDHMRNEEELQKKLPVNLLKLQNRKEIACR